MNKTSVKCHRCGSDIPLVKSTLINTDAVEIAYGVCQNCCIVIEMTEIDGLDGWDKKRTFSGDDAFLIMSQIIKQLTGE